jgi:hypothetical protein
VNKSALAVVAAFVLIFAVMLASQLFTPKPQNNASHYPLYPGYLPRGGGSVTKAPPPEPACPISPKPPRAHH